jgi:exosome complex component RRP46
MEVKQRKEHIDRATVEIVFKPQNGLEGTIETEQEYFIRNTVENVVIAALHPRTSITIVIQVLNDDGSVHFILE